MPERSYIKQNTTKRFSNSYNAEITTNKLDTVVDRYPKHEQVTPNSKHYANHEKPHYSSKEEMKSSSQESE